MPAIILLAAIAAAAPAQAQAAPAGQNATPPPAFITAAQAFGGCMRNGATKRAVSTATPETDAHAIVTACASQKTSLETQFTSWINGPSFPEAGRDQARQAFRAQIDGVEGELASQLRSSRAATATAPTSGPVPGATGN